MSDNEDSFRSPALRRSEVSKRQHLPTLDPRRRKAKRRRSEEFKSDSPRSSSSSARKNYSRRIRRKVAESSDDEQQLEDAALDEPFNSPFIKLDQPSQVDSDHSHFRKEQGSSEQVPVEDEFASSDWNRFSNRKKKNKKKKKKASTCERKSTSKNFSLSEGSPQNDSSNSLEFGYRTSQVTKDSSSAGNKVSIYQGSASVGVSPKQVDREENSVLAETLRQYRESYAQLLETNPEARARYIRKQPRGVNQESPARSGTSTASVSREKLWTDMFESLDDSFLYSREARMRGKIGRSQDITGRSMKNKYAGIQIDTDNCQDMQFLFEKEFLSRVRRNSPHSDQSFSNLKVAVGQLARLAVANDTVIGECLYQAGELFGIATQKDLFELFIGHFEMEGSESTAMSKARHCILFSTAALKYFQKNPPYPNNAPKNGKVEEKIYKSLAFLREKAAENKRGSRHEAALARSVNGRIEAGRLITENDFDLFRSHARSRLADILQSYKLLCSENPPRDHTERQKLVSELFSNKLLLCKWSMNFLVLLMMYGNGQRTQVYTFLKVPEEGYIHDYMSIPRRERKTNPFLLEINEKEKRPRDIILGSVLFNSIVARYVQFHVDLVLPYLHEKFDIPIGDSRRQALLLHTMTGKKINTYSVRRSLCKFCQEIDDELHVTPTMLGASYASYMVKEYVRGASNGEYGWGGKDPENFIEMLAKVMNTGVDMISEVYASATRLQYNQFVGKMLGIVKSSEAIDEE